MANAIALAWELLAKDQASPAFNKAAASMDRAASSAEKAQSRIAGANAKMGAVGAKMTKAVTLPLLGIAAVATDQAIKYQKSLNTIKVATDQSASSMALAQKQLLVISQKTATSTNQLTDALYTAAKSGQPMAQALKTVTAAAQGAKAENADLGVVTNALTSIMASYGSKLSDPVKAMNMIVRGSGFAKTSLQDFANSLSTVVPVAASLGIGFDQVAGAIDTMTQHGETAQHATENLRNLITNLAGQNNVASQALQQLGVNTIDLSKNLGARGLTGSLNLVLEAIAKHSKDGMVVTSAFKQAAVASQSLRTELDAMPRSMQANAKAFVAGTMSYKDYLAYTKSLGGQQYAMARQLITTQQAAQGFNNQLKNGNSTTRTLASTLQKALGGVTGMNVALQLSGESAGKFNQYVKEVGDAANTSGKDVLGFADTQKTAAFRLDAAKAALHAAAIELGTELIPVVTKVANLFAGAVHWFDGLDSGQKKLLGFTAVALAAAGPIMSLGSKMLSAVGMVTRGAVGIGSALTRIAGTSFTTSVRVSNAIQGMTAALGGAAIGYAVGSLTKNSSTGVKALGALGSAAAGAAIGFQAGGPWGAAIGGAAGLLGSLASAFHRSSSSALSATSGIDAYTQAIKADSDALGRNVRALTANDLSKSGAFKAGRLLGLDPKTVLNAALGVKSAVSTVNAALDDARKHADAFGSKKDKADLAAVGILGSSLAGEKQAVKAGLQNARDIAQATSVAGKNDAARAKALQAVTTAQNAAAKSLQGLGQQLDINAATGKSSVPVLTDMIAKYQAIEKAQVLAGVSSGTAAKQFDTSTAALRAQAVQAGVSGGAVDKLIAKYNLTPKQIVTNMLLHINQATASASQLQKVIDSIRQNRIPGLTANTKQGQAAISALQARINALQGKTVTVTSVVKTVRQVVGNVTGILSGRASGGGLPEGVSAVGERGPELAVKRGSHVEILSNGQSKAFLAATGMRAPGFATGTGGIVHAGKDWIYNGIRYDSERAAENARTRVAKSAASAQARARSSLLGTVNREGGGLEAIAMSGNVTSLTSRLTQLRNSLSDAGVRGSWITRIVGDSKRLEAATKALGDAKKRLDAAKALKAADAKNTSDAITGSFDITSAGVNSAGQVAGQSILAQSRQAVVRAKAFYSGLMRLAKLKVLPPSYLRSIAAKGPDALPEVQALNSLPMKQLQQLQADKAELNTLGSKLGASVSGILDQGAVDKASRDVKRDQAVVNVDTKRLGEDLASAVHSAFADLHVESRVKGSDLVLVITAAQKKNAHTRGSAR